MFTSASLLPSPGCMSGVFGGRTTNKSLRLTPCKTAASRRRTIISNSLSLPEQYGYVMASVATTALVVQWMSVRVALARRDCKVAYPAVYAEGSSEEALRFNCTQRAHQNTLESVPMLLALEILLGLQYPLFAAGLGMAWNAGRVLYALGYSTGDPSKRTPGAAVSGVVYLILILSTLVAGSKLVFA